MRPNKFSTFSNHLEIEVSARVFIKQHIIAEPLFIVESWPELSVILA